MEELAASFETRPVLFLTEERSVRTVSEYRERFSKWYRFTMPNHTLLMELMHKEAFRALAVKHGSPIPASIQIRTDADLLDADKLRYPCILKPSFKNYDYAKQFKKAYKVWSANEVHDIFAKVRPVLSDLILQEWIEGPDSDIFFCLQYRGPDGDVLSSFVGRKIRSWPPHVGGTASCTVSSEHCDLIEKLTNDFFSAVGFVGMGSMEFKKHSETGELLMVEPTVARTDYQQEVATLNGTNIPMDCYCAELGIPKVDRHRVVPPVIWRDPLSDRWSASLEGSTAPVWSRGYRTCDAYWRPNDPLPWIHLAKVRIAGRLRAWSK
jgi:predicted ATP-grasp superfamily ATP-dependent carboligase